MVSTITISAASAGAATLVILVLLGYYLYRRRRQDDENGSGNINSERSTMSSSNGCFMCCCASDSDDEQQSILNTKNSKALTTAGNPSAPLMEQYRRSSSGLAASGGAQSKNKKAPKRYKVKKRLGEGAYGTVYLAIRTEDHLAVALKVVPCVDEADAQQAMQEYQLCLESQGHEHIVKLYDVFFDEPDEQSSAKLYGTTGTPIGKAALADTPVMLRELGVRTRGGVKYLIIVSEYCEAGTLFDLLLTKRTDGDNGRVVLSEGVIWNYTEQLLDALSHMHSRNVMHRDLKPSNVLLSSSFQRTILTDFGLSRAVNADEYVQTRTGTLQYLSPEQVMRRYNHKSDVWGTGCLMYAMCTARITNEKARVMFRDRNKPTFEQEIAHDLRMYSSGLQGLLLKLLARNAGDRPSAAEALDLCRDGKAEFLRATPAGE